MGGVWTRWCPRSLLVLTAFYHTGRIRFGQMHWVESLCAVLWCFHFCYLIYSLDQFWGLGTTSSILLIFQVRKYSPEMYSHTSSPKVPGQKGEDMIPVDVTFPVPILLWLSLGDTWRHPHPPQTRGCSQGRPLPQDSIEPKGWFSQSDYTHSSLTNLPV